MLHLLLAAAAVTAPAPARPPDGTYTYAVGQGSDKAMLSSTIVVKSGGATFDVVETAKLPNGQSAVIDTTWSSATLLPLRYALHQGTLALSAPVTPSSAKFTGSLRTSYTALPGTKYMLVYEGLNAFRMMLPFVVAAHPGETFSIVQLDANRVIEGNASAASPAPGGPAGDAGAVIAVDKDQHDLWYNPRTHVVDRAVEMPGDARMWLVKYVPASGGA